MNDISNSFFENEKILKKGFKFEELCKQLKYISQFPEKLPKTPEESLIRKAKLIRNKIFIKGWTDSRIKNSILYVQAREIIDEYVSSLN